MTSAQLEVDLGANSPLEALNAHILLILHILKIANFDINFRVAKKIIPKFFGSIPYPRPPKVWKNIIENMFLTKGLHGSDFQPQFQPTP